MANLDLAGIITRVCTNLRAKFSKVTVTRIMTSGTKSATVTVDGVKYDLYAPAQPFASTTAPLMDGTASYGSGNFYARSNHVHPTDTSRQATLVSGTNIKTINGTSLLGSGNITISGGGGGGASYTTQAVSIPVSAWSGTTATVSVAAVTSTSDVIVAPAPSSISAWAAAGVYCSAQGSGTLTFTCSTAPTAALTANVMAFEGGNA